MKISVNRNPIKLRKEEYRKKDGESLHAIWDALETLSQQGIDIGGLARSELNERKKIKERFRK